MNNLTSVISPTYNSERHIEKLLECVSNQSLPVLEHIIIDDGSTDNTLILLNELKSQYPHVKVISQTNQGAGAARNKGISVAKGKYIAFLDSDDIWAEDKLKAQIEFMEREGIDLSYGNYFEIDSRDNFIHEKSVPDRLTYKELLKSCPIGCLTVAFNQQTLGKHYMPFIRRGQDWALWLKITKLGITAHRYPGTFAFYRVGKGSLSQNKIKKAFNMYKIYRLQGLNYFSSCYYLFCFTISKLRK